MKKYNLYVVYFINCMCNPNYSEWLQHQLKYITSQINNKNVKLLNKSKIFIIATIEKTRQKEFLDKLHNFFPRWKRTNQNKPIFKVMFFEDNEYEYQGIKKVWELGQIHNKKNDIILYYHSKGVTRNTNYISNKNDNYNIILKDINKIVKILTNILTLIK